MQIADVMVSEGYSAAGYKYVSIDDCWMLSERGPDGRLQPDPARFPSGMKALADYVSWLKPPSPCVYQILVVMT